MTAFTSFLAWWILCTLTGKSSVYRRYPNMKCMAWLRMSWDTREIVCRSVSGRNLMISQKISRGNSGDGFDDVIVDSDQGKDDKWKENIKKSRLFKSSHDSLICIKVQAIEAFSQIFCSSHWRAGSNWRMTKQHVRLIGYANWCNIDASHGFHHNNLNNKKSRHRWGYVYWNLIVICDNWA